MVRSEPGVSLQSATAELQSVETTLDAVLYNGTINASALADQINAMAPKHQHHALPVIHSHCPCQCPGDRFICAAPGWSQSHVRTMQATWVIGTCLLLQESHLLGVRALRMYDVSFMPTLLSTLTQILQTFRHPSSCGVTVFLRNSAHASMIAPGHASLGSRWVTSLKHAVPKSNLCPVQSQLNSITDPNAANGANTYFNQLSSATTAASGKSRSCPVSTCSRPFGSAVRRKRRSARKIYWTCVLECSIMSEAYMVGVTSP